MKESLIGVASDASKLRIRKSSNNKLMPNKQACATNMIKELRPEEIIWAYWEEVINMEYWEVVIDSIAWNLERTEVA